MTVNRTLSVAIGLALLGVSAQAQQAEPGTGSTQVTPASASPVTSAQPNLRTDSKPHVYASPSTDSGPVPETLGPDNDVPMDIGLDYSMVPSSDEQRAYTVIYSDKGVTQIPEAPAVAGPVTNPPEPSSRVLETPPEPPSRQMLTPASPLPQSAVVIPPR